MQEFDLLETAQELTGLSQDRVEHLIESIAIIAILVLLRWVALRIVFRQTDELKVQYQAKKIATYTAVGLGVFLVGRIWFQGIHSIAVFGGLLSAGVAIALRDPIVNLAGWVFIIWRRPFSVGDRIQVGEQAGDVVDQRVFQFTLLEIGNWVDADQSTGRIIHVPNGVVFTDALANYVGGFRFIWNEIPVLVTFESDWRAAKQILLEAVEKHAEKLEADDQKRLLVESRRFMIYYSALTPTVYTAVRDSGVLLTIRYLCDPRRRRGSSQSIWEEILDRFAEREDIDFAYPTQRFYDNVREGKPEARAQPEIAGGGGDSRPPPAPGGRE